MPNISGMALIWNDLGSFLKGPSKVDKENTVSKDKEDSDDLKNKIVPSVDDENKANCSAPILKLATESSSIEENKQIHKQEHEKSNISKQDIDEEPLPAKKDLTPNISTKSSSNYSPPSNKNIRIPIKDASNEHKVDSFMNKYKCATNTSTINQESKSDCDQNLAMRKNSESPLKSKDSTAHKEAIDRDNLTNLEIHKDLPETKESEPNIKHGPADSDEFDKHSEKSKLDKSLPKLKTPNKELGNEGRSQNVKDKECELETKKQVSRRKSDRKQSPSQSVEVRDAVSASRSSSLLGNKRASSKPVPRKVDYGKRALSSSDAEEETSEDDSDSDTEDKKAECSKGTKKDEKSTLKKRRKEYKPSRYDEKTKTDTEDSLTLKKDADSKIDEQVSSNRKKSKAGAKRKPTEISSGSVNKESEDIKRREYFGANAVPPINL